MGVRVSSAEPRPEQYQRGAAAQRHGRFGGRDWLATVVVTLTTVGIQWLRVRDTFFAIDDFIFSGIARAQPFGVHLLRKPIFEHFSPAFWTENKAEVGLLHANHGVALALGLVITAIGVASMHRLLLRLTRSPGWAILLSGLYGSSLILTAILRWWTTSIHDNLAATLSVACLLAFCRFEEERRARDAWLSIVLLAGTLLTHEKALLVPLYLGLAWLLVYQRRLAPGKLWMALRRELWLWICYTVLWAASLANFLAYYYQPRTGPALKDLGVFALRSVFTTFLPVSYGIRLPEVGGSVGGGVQALAAIGLLAAIVITCRVARGAGRGWLFFAVAFIANLWVLGTARLPVFPTGVYRALQWQLELAFLFPIGLGMVIREARVGRDHNRRGTSGRPWLVVALLLLAIPYAWLSGRSNTVVRSEFNGGDFSRPFLAALSKGVADARSAGGPAPTLLDRPLPGTFAPDWMFPYNMLRELLPTFRVRAGLGAHAAGGPVFVVDDNGSLHRYDLASVLQPSLLVRTSGHPGGGGSTCAALEPAGAVFRATWPAPGGLGSAPVLRVDYRADRPATIAVISSGPDGRPKELSYGQLSMDAADNQYDLLLQGPLSSDHIDLVITGDQGGSFCVDGLALGAPTRVGG